eukprot:scaffold81178_cov47-Prasinocladus_malaysianus.AAC.2
MSFKLQWTCIVNSKRSWPIASNNCITLPAPYDTASATRDLQYLIACAAKVVCLSVNAPWKDAPHLGAFFRSHPDIICLATITTRSITLIADAARGPCF